MPELVLFDDAGGELFRSTVSQENVQIVAAFLRRNMGALRSAAAMLQAYRQSMAQLDQLIGVAAPKPRARRRRA